MLGVKIFDEDDTDKEIYHYFEDPDAHFVKEISAENAEREDDVPVEVPSEQKSSQRL